MRSKKAPKRIITPDPIYSSRTITKFINRVMIDGKKSIAQKLIYKALEQVGETTKENPIAVFERAMVNVSPKMEVRPRRIGGASYQVPVEVRGDRREALAIRWLIAGAQARSNREFHGFDKKLAAEILDAANNTGVAIKKKEDIQKTAAANRAFSHFRW
jgi:small subunit ribosomal protein S7